MTFFRQTRFKPSSPVGNLPLSLRQPLPREFKAAKGWMPEQLSQIQLLGKPWENVVPHQQEEPDLGAKLLSGFARLSCWNNSRTLGQPPGCTGRQRKRRRLGSPKQQCVFWGEGDIYAGNTAFRRRSYHRRCCASVILIGSMRQDGAGSKRVWSIAGRRVHSGGKAVWGGLSPPPQVRWCKSLWDCCKPLPGPGR